MVTTLGTGRDEQIIDAVAGEYRERFMLHYNFPVLHRRMRPRRLAEAPRDRPRPPRQARAGAVLPSKEESFSYTVRVVSEITESNGSSSMASVCGGSLAMMDAGVPLSAPVAGIAMGLIRTATVSPC